MPGREVLCPLGCLTSEVQVWTAAAESLLLLELHLGRKASSNPAVCQQLLHRKSAFLWPEAPTLKTCTSDRIAVLGTDLSPPSGAF